MIRYPGRLDEGGAAWLAETGGSVRNRTDALSARYRRGGVSSAFDVVAYLTTRLPATFAANARVMADIATTFPEFAPASLRDVGAGPGTASWAAIAQWSSLHSIEQLETMMEFCALARQLNVESGLAALEQTQVMQGNLRDLPKGKTDLVVASYVLAELPETEVAALGWHLWQQANLVLVLIEPGTPHGFARIRSVRERLLRDGAHLVGPCTHDQSCPMDNGDWCHFKQRVQRSRAHMHAKGATVPYEDEPFSWLAVSRFPVVRQSGRVVAPVTQTKAGIKFRVCAEGHLSDVHVASRDKATYKQLKKISWGDTVSSITPG